MSGTQFSPALTRRTFLGGAASLSGLSLITNPTSAAASPHSMYTLKAEAGKATLLGKNTSPINIWVYNGIAPGPVLRVRQGNELRVQLIE